ncbi:CDP-glycerol glycerophosphotransferase family protein [Bibersteinia trehalosi]|uniref:CDP-glycerol glycerophosphotransferase family protein n=1 Tax=Bibersteinia trehalosi TaxID=47735 RepID=UPI0040462EDC
MFKLKKLFTYTKYPISYWKGMKFYKKKNWDKAKYFFDKAVKKSPLHPESNFKLGMCFFKLKEWEHAHKYIKTAVELLPSKEEWKVQLYQSELRMTSIQGTQLTASASSIEENLIRKRLETEDGSAKLYSRLAELLHKQGKAWQEVEALKNAISYSDKNSQIYIRLASALSIMKRYNEASLMYQRAIELKGNKVDAELYYELGYINEQEGVDGEKNIELASFAYKKAIELDKEFDSFRFGIGIFHEKKGRWFDAIRAYNDSFLKNTSDSELCYKLGFSYQRCYDWKKAEKFYLKAIELNNKEPNWFYQVGFVRERQGKFMEAAHFYKIAIEKKYTSYWNYRLGLCLANAKKFKESTLAFLKTKRSFKEEYLDDKLFVFKPNKLITKLNSSLSLDSTNVENWCKLGELYLSRGELIKAENAYKNALFRKNEYDSNLYYTYGLILTKLGKYKKAVKYLRCIRQVQKLYGLPERKFNEDSGFRQAAIYSEYYDVLAIEPKVILFESFSGVSMSCNPLAIFLEMLSSNKYKDFLFVWVINDLSSIDDRYKTYENIVFVQKDSDLYLRYLCVAKYLVNNATFPPYFTRKEEQKYLNTWHGTPWKTLGKDIKNSFMELKNSQRNFLQSTHMISPNKHTSWVLIDRYDIRGIYSGKFLESGYPRIDLTLNSSEKRKDELKSILGINKNKKTVLYAPTWRGTLGSPEVEAEKLISEIKELNSLDINLLFRGHYFVQENAYEGGVSKYIVPDNINTNELLSIVDILITDYSSIGFDYMATGKPLVYYIDDYDEYKEERGLYFEHNILPGSMARNISELKELISSEIKNNSLHPLYKESQEKFTPYDDGNVSKRIVSWFIDNEYFENEISTLDKAKKSLLIFGGEFLPNGITTSLINLLNNIDYDRFTVSLLIDPNAIAKEEKRLAQFARLTKCINIIPRVGRMNRNIESDWIEAKANQYKYLPESMREYFEGAYHKEFKRMLGHSHFDALIEFTGYSRFWAYLLGSAKLNNVIKTIYQHNDKYGEWTLRFPHLENTFSVYYMFNNLMSVSKQTMELNIKNLCSRFNLEESKFNYCDNVQDPAATIQKSLEPIGLEDEEYFRGKVDKVFINLARLSPEKDQAKLIRSFRALADEYPNSKLLILGDGPLFGELQSLIRELKLENNVYLLGIRFNPFPLLRKADCFVLSSNHEGQPMTLFEAMILGKPIISTDIVGSRSALEGRPGHLVPNNEEGLYQGMKDFINDKLNFYQFDYESYQKNALSMFYTKVCS